MIILEGPDGAGKTFTAERMSSLTGKKLYHFGGPPKNSKELFERLKVLEKNPDFIFDRCSIISEPIYGPIIRGVSLFEASWESWQKMLLERNPTIIYCRPSIETIFKTKLKSKSWKSPELVEGVKNNLNKIIIAYDKMMLNFDVTYFNRDTTTIEELCVALML